MGASDRGGRGVMGRRRWLGAGVASLGAWVLPGRRAAADGPCVPCKSLPTPQGPSPQMPTAPMSAELWWTTYRKSCPVKKITQVNTVCYYYFQDCATGYQQSYSDGCHDTVQCNQSDPNGYCKTSQYSRWDRRERQGGGSSDDHLVARYLIERGLERKLKPTETVAEDPGRVWLLGTEDYRIAGPGGRPVLVRVFLILATPEDEQAGGLLPPLMLGFGQELEGSDAVADESPAIERAAGHYRAIRPRRGTLRGHLFHVLTAAG